MPKAKNPKKAGVDVDGADRRRRLERRRARRRARGDLGQRMRQAAGASVGPRGGVAAAARGRGAEGRGQHEEEVEEKEEREREKERTVEGRCIFFCP